MILIRKGDKTKISKNFQHKEFFTKAPGVEEHYLHEGIPTAMQYVRGYYNAPVFINSTFRPLWYNTALGSLSTSTHIKALAVDFSFRNDVIHQQFVKDILQKGALYQHLRSMGVNGIGIYDTFIHLDFRQKPAFWDNRKKKA